MATAHSARESHASSTVHGKANGDRINLDEAQPLMKQRGRETQPYGTLARLPLGIDDKVRAASVEGLNQVLVDTITLRRHVQEAPLAGLGRHVLFASPAARQARGRADRARRHHRRAYPDVGRYLDRHGRRRPQR